MTILQLDNISMKYAGNTKLVLKQINYTVQRGDFVILLGSNGSGKSTLLKLLHRHHQQDSGEIYFLGKPITRHHTRDFSRAVSVLTQDTSDSLFTSLSIYENYCLMKPPHHDTGNLSDRAFLSQYLLEFNPNLATHLDTLVSQLSGGEKQALALALCLLEPPALLLLDEHTSALDPNTSQQIMQLTQKMITQHHITCILTTHDLDIALRYGNRILVLHEGAVNKTFDKAEPGLLTKEILAASYY